MLAELRHNARSRLRHEAVKLVNGTKELQKRVKSTSEMVSKPLQEDGQTPKPVPSVSMEDVTNRGEALLQMLEEVSC